MRTNCEISENRFDSEFMELSTDSKDLTCRLATFHMQDLLSKEGKTNGTSVFLCSSCAEDRYQEMIPNEIGWDRRGKNTKF